MAFIDVLNSLLRENGISRNKFCADLHIGKNSVAHWENRGNTPDGEVLSEIAVYFNVTTDYLLGIKNPATPEEEQPALTEAQKAKAEILDMLDNVPDDKLEKFKAVVQAAIDAVK